MPVFPSSIEPRVCDASTFGFFNCPLYFSSIDLPGLPIESLHGSHKLFFCWPFPPLSLYHFSLRESRFDSSLRCRKVHICFCLSLSRSVPLWRFCPRELLFSFRAEPGVFAHLFEVRSIGLDERNSEDDTLFFVYHIYSRRSRRVQVAWGRGNLSQSLCLTQESTRQLWSVPRARLRSALCVLR